MASTKRARIFISYKRVEPDTSVAREVFEALSQQHDVFIDQVIPVGVRWGERIEAEIRQADVFIAFLSADSIYSEMVVAEISTAYQLTKSQGGRPVILPIRLAYRAPFPYPLSAYLDAINWAFWQTPEDTPCLITELMHAVSGAAVGSAPTHSGPHRAVGAPEGSLVRSLQSGWADPGRREFGSNHFHLDCTYRDSG